ncbi:2-succinyl-5-enolpyruvyl-6-hydroxy-3-cyclohexene-1-carboxylate synthase [Nocardioides scoriae]|uniref:2-succinyl-5-enolpyruvyl-6-hydroxy-3-cyclohexene-1-carboxylate synthase n=1 Tax=Nocardioides scoriae TaxID=642780 RepID=A0A1H1TQU5_9ACTN|nr:2-succinyl-5-enolpyruvyl-6-hydroxy-3-cyclohexene-1-carboxylic-acid synthase [Nocardioides scoriae]SDS62695.1 2-succinyl-5-enolpyruvyl-6-hydroxy-3-cyclohexene-1-carboxylate synthase [Nocardioides scoriae]
MSPDAPEQPAPDREPAPAPQPSQVLATWLVDRLVEQGASEAVLCPGSRNAPLAFALAADERVRLHTRIDERTAGFLALGLAKASRRPVPVVTTSGTASANLHPAVLEAAHAGVRLVAVTADRPARLRGTGANQTTDQVRLFGDAAGFADLAAPDDTALEALFAVPGPVHLDVQLDDPLVPPPGQPVRPAPGPRARDAAPHPWRRRTDQVPLPLGRRTVVVAGDDAGPPARLLAQDADWPLLAEPSSGSRTGTHALRTYRLLLGTGLGDRVERVVVAGHPTLSRPVARLLARPDVEVVSVPAAGRWPTRPFPVDAEHEAVRAERDDPAWLEEWRAADRELSRRIDAFVAARPGLTPYEVAQVVDAANPPGGLLVVGASNPVRDLDLMAGAHPAGERRMVLANRGLAGIDGTLSTAIGAALARDRSTRATAYVGDVTFLHDLTGLVVGPREARPDLTIVVANDDGGSIFATLEQGGPAYADRFEQLFATPHGVDLAALCAATRTPHWRVESRAELEHALASPNGGIEVVEAVVRRDDRRELDEAIRALAHR